MEQLKLNMIPNGVNPVFHASQYDKGRQIRFVLDETLSGAEVTTSYRAKDGTEHGNVQTSVSGNTITDTIPEEVLTDYGIIEGEVNIDGIGSLNFFIEVEKDAYDGGDIITQTATGAIATFETNIETAFVSLKSDINPVQSGTGTPSPDNVRPISGFSALNVTLADGDMQTIESKTVNFGQTVYDGKVDVTGGSVVSEWGYFTIPTIANYNTSGGHNYTYNTPTGMIVEGGTHFDLIAEALASNGTLGDKFTMYRINNGVVIGVPDNFTVADYNSQIAGTHLLYPLATPIEITTTPENLTAISGVNNVYSDTNGDTTVEYYIEV